jgi:hypothetical protein
MGDSLFENMELFGISRRQMLDLIQVGWIILEMILSGNNYLTLPKNRAYSAKELNLEGGFLFLIIFFRCRLKFGLQ